MLAGINKHVLYMQACYTLGELLHSLTCLPTHCRLLSLAAVRCAGSGPPPAWSPGPPAEEWGQQQGGRQAGQQHQVEEEEVQEVQLVASR
jgi:hypothetical protein